MLRSQRPKFKKNRLALIKIMLGSAYIVETLELTPDTQHVTASYQGKKMCYKQRAIRKRENYARECAC